LSTAALRSVTQRHAAFRFQGIPPVYTHGATGRARLSRPEVGGSTPGMPRVKKKSKKQPGWPQGSGPGPLGSQAATQPQRHRGPIFKKWPRASAHERCPLAICHWPLAIGHWGWGPWPLVIGHDPPRAACKHLEQPHAPLHSTPHWITSHRAQAMAHWPLAIGDIGQCGWGPWPLPIGHWPLAVGHCGWDPWPSAIGHWPLGWGRRVHAGCRPLAIGRSTHWPLAMPLALGCAHARAHGQCTRTRTHPRTHARTPSHRPSFTTCGPRVPLAIGHWQPTTEGRPPGPRLPSLDRRHPAAPPQTIGNSPLAIRRQGPPAEPASGCPASPQFQPGT